MKRWPVPFTMDIGGTFIMFTCFMFTFITLGNYFILAKELDAQRLITTLILSMFLSILSILLDLKKWREKLIQAREALKARKGKG
jgi:hypothetical protein